MTTSVSVRSALMNKANGFVAWWGGLSQPKRSDHARFRVLHSIRASSPQTGMVMSSVWLPPAAPERGTRSASIPYSSFKVLTHHRSKRSPLALLGWVIAAHEPRGWRCSALGSFGHGCYADPLVARVGHEVPGLVAAH